MGRIIQHGDSGMRHGSHANIVSLADVHHGSLAMIAIPVDVQEGLKKIRKKILIRTGSSYVPPPEPPPGPKQSALSLSRDIGGRSAGGAGTPDVKGKMFRKFFQAGGDDDDDGNQESHLDDRGVDPDEMWASVRGELDDM